jgi:hypothetical protein
MKPIVIIKRAPFMKTGKKFHVWRKVCTKMVHHPVPVPLTHVSIFHLDSLTAKRATSSGVNPVDSRHDSEQ